MPKHLAFINVNGSVPAGTVNLGETTYLEHIPQHCPKANLSPTHALQPHIAGCSTLVYKVYNPLGCFSPREHPSPGYLSGPVKHKPGTISYSHPPRGSARVAVYSTAQLPASAKGWIRTNVDKNVLVSSCSALSLTDGVME